MELNLIKPILATSVNVNIRALVKAVGIRPNYTEYNYDTKSIKYINEKNAFGDGIALNKNAILLYVYLHFLNVNANAHAVLDTYEASKYLSIPERTVIHNMKILNRKDIYDSVKETSPELIISSLTTMQTIIYLHQEVDQASLHLQEIYLINCEP